MTAGTGSIERTCRACSKSFRISPSAAASGKGKTCSVACTRKVGRPVGGTPSKRTKPGTIGPSRDFVPLIDKGGAVICARCLRVRGFGVRCSCERREP